MQSNSLRFAVWCSGILAVVFTQNAFCQAPPAANALTKEQDKLARDFARGRAPASEEAMTALRLKIATEVDRLKFPPAKNFEEAQMLAKLADTRANIDSTWVSGAKDQTARKVAAEAIASYGQQLLSERNVSPQSKVNCMAMLAELDEAGTTGTLPPTPSEKAFVVLFTVAKNEQEPIYLRAIALHGVNRNIGRWWPTNKWPDAGKKAIEKAMTDIVNSEPKTPLEMRAHAWMVRRAYDCLSTMGSAFGANSALNRLADSKALPSLRMSALEYLSHLDTSGFPEEKKSLHLIGLAHFTRSQLVNWYEKEDDILKAKSGAGAGAMGGYGGSSMGGYGESMGSSMGGYGESMGGAMGGYGDSGSSAMGGYGSSMGGYGGSSMGGYGGSSGAAKKPKPIDTQTWQVRLSRRMINQISQVAHVALDGIPLPEEKPVAGVKPLKEAKLPDEAQAKIAELVEAIEAFQIAVNDPEKVTSMTSLLTQAEGNIEEIMDLVKEVPGFLERYPELVPDDELQTAEDPEAMQPPADPTNPDAPVGPDAPVDSEAPSDPGAAEAPAEERPAAPPEDATAANR